MDYKYRNFRCIKCGYIDKFLSNKKQANIINIYCTKCGGRSIRHNKGVNR